MTLVAHVGPGSGGVVPDTMTVETFVIFVDLAVEVVNETLKVSEIVFLWDEHAMALKHVISVCVDVRLFVVAEQAVGRGIFSIVCGLFFILLFNSGCFEVFGSLGHICVVFVGLVDWLAKRECRTHHRRGIIGMFFVHACLACFVLRAVHVVLVGVLAVERLLASSTGFLKRCPGSCGRGCGFGGEHLFIECFLSNRWQRGNTALHVIQAGKDGKELVFSGIYHFITGVRGEHTANLCAYGPAEHRCCGKQPDRCCRYREER